MDKSRKNFQKGQRKGRKRKRKEKQNKDDTLKNRKCKKMCFNSFIQ